ncbi:hypothetical protein [Halalkalibacter oceani]|uniref:hypothetical protein n=1 Tax=Halalkalibacter oceani TaxID=1653776 RepID=UPI003397792A
MSNDWYLMSNPTPLSGFEKSEFESYYSVFNEILEQSPEAYLVNVDGMLKHVIIQSRNKDDEFNLLSNTGDVKMGDLILYKDQYYLAVSYPFSNKIYEKTLIKYCNNILKVKVDEIREITGKTSLGEPIYNTTPIYYEQPCHFSNENGTTYNTTFYEQINVPLGRISILTPYRTNANLITEGMEFQMYDSQYKISNVDKTRVKNNQGFLELFVERIQLSNK